ncbi:MAG: restriction endonuclease [Rhodoblastus sp.]|nr:restriction endonuclease [Rhodoblastus sp.]MCB9997596.1 restriction endonuclease [Methylobacteriaceae bacterium]MCO5086267.1 restriction endonuclease [Methylobacteriaceae bacterium]
MEAKRIWCVRAGASGEADFLFLKRNQVAMSFEDMGGDVASLPAARDAFKEAFARAAPAARASSIPISAGQLYRFVHEMRIGDNVIYPRKSDRTVRWGEVVAPYVFDTDDLNEFGHRRGVRWIGKLSRDSFSQGALYELGSALTFFEVKSFAEEFREKFADPDNVAEVRTSPAQDETEDGVLRDIEETTRDFISKRIKTDLKGSALEPFVASLFRAMGYNARATRAVRDDGIDVIAHRDELGIEPPILKIQVKSHDANICADHVKAFYAMVQERDVGIFITTGDYTASAASFARSKGNLKLIDGSGFVELIQKYYDRLDMVSRETIRLRRVLVPDAQSA